ncbi:MAG: hypothetical protein R3Y29_00840 [bacterium]
MSENIIRVIIDSSGSMNEWGKSDCIVNLVSTTRFYTKDEKFKDFKVEYYLYKKKEIVNITSFKEITKFKPEGDLDINLLFDFINNLEESSTKNKILFLSDGNFLPEGTPEGNVEKLKRKVSKINLNKNIILPISIGCDSNLQYLKAINTTMQKVYLSESIIQAINDICFMG